MVEEAARVVGGMPCAEAQVSNADHAAIVDALARGDSASAERLMREHIVSLAMRLDERLARDGRPRDRLRAAVMQDEAESDKRVTARTGG